MLEVDSLCPDSLSEIEEEIEEAAAEDRIDDSFDDFLFAFTHSIKFFYERIRYPLMLTSADGEQSELRQRNLHREFQFLEGDFYTVFYSSVSQIEQEKVSLDGNVSVERIDMDGRMVRTYSFSRLEGKWMLTDISDSHFSSSELADFLLFYSHFSADSVFQQQHIEQPLRISILDPDGSGEYIEGSIDVAQWTSFCSEMPSGVISNIRYGQSYTPSQIVMQKCGGSNGMEELFTFRKDNEGWCLVAYEE